LVAVVGDAQSKRTTQISTVPLPESTGHLAVNEKRQPAIHATRSELVGRAQVVHERFDRSGLIRAEEKIETVRRL
jgi:hypothetical protein